MMSDLELESLVQRMIIPETEDARGEIYNPNVVRGTYDNNSQQGTISKDDSISSLDDSYILLEGKSETGKPYSKIDDQNNIFRSGKVEINEFPGSLLQLVGAPLDQGKPNLLDRVVGSYKFFCTR